MANNPNSIFNKYARKKQQIIIKPTTSLIYSDPQTVKKPSIQSINKYSKQVRELNRPNSQKKNIDKNQNRSAISNSSIKKYASPSVISRNQFKKYFTDTQNVFYEDRYQAKLLTVLGKIKQILIFLWIVLAISLFILGRVTPYQGVCPIHADCGVFVHCHQGFYLEEEYGRQTCVIDPEFIEKASSICQTVISQLQTSYGNLQCSQNPTQDLPSMSFYQLIKQFSIESQVLEDQIRSFLRKGENQNEYNFAFYNNQIRPTIKQYSFICSAYLLTQTKTFKILVIIVIVLMILSGFIAYKLIRYNKSRKIYSKILEKVKEKKQIAIKDFIEEQWGQIDQNIWVMINCQRSKQGKIGCYQEDVLYWRLLN